MMTLFILIFQILVIIMQNKMKKRLYGVKGYQLDVDGSVYDQAFVIGDGDFTLQTNLDMNGFDIKRYYKGYTIDNDTIRLQEHLDLNGYRLRNFRPKIILFGEWKAGENVESSKTYVKFGNSTYIMTPFPCILDGVSVLIIDNAQNYERVGFRFEIEPSSSSALSNTTFKSIRNANGLKYQYAEPVLSGGSRRININAGQYIRVISNKPDDRLFGNLTTTKHALVCLILLDDFSFML